MPYFNTDQSGGVEKLDAYLTRIDRTPSPFKKPFPCPWLRVLPEELVTEVIGKKERHAKGTLYCTEQKGPCQVKGMIMAVKPREDGAPLVGIECAVGHQLVVGIESFLTIRRPTDAYQSHSKDILT